MTDSTTRLPVVDVAASAAAAAAAAGVNGEDHFSATSALISYLRLEADLCEEKARRLRQQANFLAQKHGITTNAQDAYGK